MEARAPSRSRRSLYADLARVVLSWNTRVGLFVWIMSHRFGVIRLVRREVTKGVLYWATALNARHRTLVVVSLVGCAAAASRYSVGAFSWLVGFHSYERRIAVCFVGC